MIKGHLELLILAVLQMNGSMHGYRIRQELADCSHQVFQPSFGRLYPCLAEMERVGWLKSRREMVCDRRERNAYSITAKGRIELKRRMKKWELFSEGINQIIKHVRPG